MNLDDALDTITNCDNTKLNGINIICNNNLRYIPYYELMNISCSAIGGKGFQRLIVTGKI